MHALATIGIKEKASPERAEAKAYASLKLGGVSFAMH
jgi:hypothetical protein